MKKGFLLSVIILFVSRVWGQHTHIDYRVSDSLLQFSEVKLAFEDARQLLKKATQSNAAFSDTVFIQLTDEWMYAERKMPKPYPVIEVDNHAYRWETQISSTGKRIHTLSSPSTFGLACGLYGLMQEALGFSFHHPREMYIPDLSQKWPLGEDFSMEVWPKFNKKGFHLHTMHPIELAEPLFNPQLPGALDEVKEYIDWLARNEQNVFDFCLMESVDRRTWIKHAKAFTEYAKSRGILTSVDVSLHMIQQKSFQLYQNPPASFRRKEKQIVKNLDWLFEAHWDIINMEFNAAEFLTGNALKRNELRRFVQHETEKRGAKLMGRQHVVIESNDLMRSKTDGAQHQAVDSSRGVLAHTVMCYSMTEAHAPVYENENQRHIFEFMKRENGIRETWYYPESAYWVTFDNSVPQLPLSYLSARLADIDTAAAYGVEGHLTFSSGWELGYWLIDWSIARWSRNVFINEKRVKNTPTQYTYGNPFAPGTGPLMDSLLHLHDTYLKEKNLMAYMTAQTVTDEIPKSLRREFHPRPPYTYGHIRNKAEVSLRDSIAGLVISPLRRFHTLGKPFIQQLGNLPNTKRDTSAFACNPNTELAAILDITGNRALHRSYTLEYLVSPKPRDKHILKKASEIRQNSMLSKYPGLKFRYDFNRLTGKFPNGTAYTSYDFGYLYTANTLHFWEREEAQAKKNRYDFLFRNIWNVFRIIGISD